MGDPAWMGILLFQKQLSYDCDILDDGIIWFHRWLLPFKHGSDLCILIHKT